MKSKYYKLLFDHSYGAFLQKNHYVNFSTKETTM